MKARYKIKKPFRKWSSLRARPQESFRKKRVFLVSNDGIHEFCWIRMALDGSLHLGFSKSYGPITETGAAYEKGTMIKLKPEARPSVGLEEGPHLSFHPPKIDEKFGIAHFKAKSGVLDRWTLDWFPVKNVKLIARAFSGPLIFKKTKVLSDQFLIYVSERAKCIRMDIVVAPRGTPFVETGNAIDVCIGFTPLYALLLCFYPVEVTPALILAIK